MNLTDFVCFVRFLNRYFGHNICVVKVLYCDRSTSNPSLFSIFGQEKSFIFASVYLIYLVNKSIVCFCIPQLFNTQAQSLLLMTSVAMPVFSKKKETVSINFNHH